MCLKQEKIAVPAQELDNIDRRLLDVIQTGFPICPRPYAVLGEQLGIEECEAWERVSRMRKSGLIRRLGANFQSSKIGFVSTLCAARVPDEKLEDFIETVNALPGVTHNYERDHSYNIWFTLISSSRAVEKEILAGITEQTGIEIINLPAEKLYKIRVDFNMDNS